MDNDEDHDDDKSISLTGFLFGNIDTKGELDEDFLDEVCNKDKNTAITSDL